MPASRLIDVSGNPVQYDFYVMDGSDPLKRRMLDLQITGKPHQVFLYFGDASEIEFVSNDGDLLELHLPLSMLADCLYVLEKWEVTLFRVGYEDTLKQIKNFVLHSVQR